MSEPDLYKGREQTWAKHLILRHYLERFARIVGKWTDGITYVDCFAGPWQQKSESFEDTSFSTAIQELKRAQATVAKIHHHEIGLRAFFVEKDQAAHAALESYVARVSKGITILTKNAELEACIPEIVQFVREGGSNDFAFIFIDPTGWTGFGIRAIEPLLRLRHTEVLINFMTKDIRRFIEHPDPQLAKSFQALFGDESPSRIVADITEPADREDALVREYMKQIRKAGGYEHISATIVLNPNQDRTHFHLIFATRAVKGLEVFKTAEKRAMSAFEPRRMKRRLEKHPKQAQELFGFAPRQETHYEMLRRRYTTKAREAVEKRLIAKTRVGYDELFAYALQAPLVFEADLKEWLVQWQRSGELRIEGLVGRKSVPQRGAGHYLVWTAARG